LTNAKDCGLWFHGVTFPPNTSSKISQTPHQKSAKRLIKKQPNATSKISQTPHLADKKTPIYLFFRILPQAHTSELTA
jgi:hypothetical protein